MLSAYRAQPARRSPGFTLIELVVVMTLVASVLAIAAPSLSQLIENARIRGAAESIQHGLQRARAEAINRNLNVTFTLGGKAFWAIADAAGNTIETRPSSEVSSSIQVVTLPANAASVTWSNLGLITDAAPLSQIDIASGALAASRNC